MLGSIVPLLALLVWDAIALGLSEQVDQVADPVELLMRVSWGGVSFMVEAFSLLAIGTSLIGTLLSFSEFFKEQLNNLLTLSPMTRNLEGRSNSDFGLVEWWTSKKISFTATAMVIVPSLFVSTTVPDAFSAATDIAVSSVLLLSTLQLTGRVLHDNALWSFSTCNGLGRALQKW